MKFKGRPLSVSKSIQLLQGKVYVCFQTAFILLVSIMIEYGFKLYVFEHDEPIAYNIHHASLCCIFNVTDQKMKSHSYAELEREQGLKLFGYSSEDDD